MNKTTVKIITTAFLLFSIFATVWYVCIGYNCVESTPLNEIIKTATEGYKMRQIIASLLLWFWGFIIVYPLCARIGAGWAYVLAMPVGNAVWGIVSAFILFLGIPYSRYTMGILGILIVVCLICKHKDTYRKIKWMQLIGVCMTVFSITLMATCGVFAVFMSSDSYYFVMQYGALIANHATLSSDIVGAYMTWTGISPALISAFATMWGFENIYAIHYLLIFSMYGFISMVVYYGAYKHHSKKIAGILAALAFLTVMTISGISYLSIWIIGNTYFMVYIVYVVMLPAITDFNEDDGILSVVSLFIVWVALSRAETALTMCFFVICISFLKLPAKRVLVLYLPMSILQILFFVNIIYQYLSGAKQASEKMLTVETAAIIFLALMLTALYIILYNVHFICYIREHMSAFVLGGLGVACLGLGILDVDKFANNIQVFISNCGDWYWKYVPLTIIVMEVFKFAFKCRNRYLDLCVWGFVLCNFAICMGRPHYLRLGVGDSFNRICMSIIPLYVVSTIYTFFVNFGGCDEEQEQ